MLAARRTLPASTADDALAARIGHELRNPLNGLCAALEVLAARPVADPAAAEALEVASRQAAKLVQLVDELLPRTGIARPGN